MCIRAAQKQSHCAGGADAFECGVETTAHRCDLWNALRWTKRRTGGACTTWDALLVKWSGGCSGHCWKTITVCRNLCAAPKESAQDQDEERRRPQFKLQMKSLVEGDKGDSLLKVYDYKNRKTVNQ